MLNNAKQTFLGGRGVEICIKKVQQAPNAALTPVHTHVNNTCENGGPYISGTFCYIPDVINGKVMNELLGCLIELR